MDKKKKNNLQKRINKGIIDILGEYFWIVGLSLIVTGMVLLYDTPKILMVSGIVIAIIGATLRLRSIKK